MRNAVFRVWAGGLLLVFGVLGIFSVCQGETWQLKFMPEVPKAGEADGKLYPPPYFFQGSSQGFYTDYNPKQKQVDPEKDPRLKEFLEVVKKEPSYSTAYPMRGVVKFGDRKFAFAMDAVPKEEPKEEAQAEEKAEAKTEEAAEEKADEEKEFTDEEKAKAEEKKQRDAMARSAFNRLYLDVNGNGDLTDDESIEATSVRAYSADYARGAFSAALPVEQDGQKVDIPCTFDVWINSWSQTIKTPDGKEEKMEQKHMGAAFYSSCFREGEIQLGDKAYRVILIDYNNNGVFNDTSEVHRVEYYRGPSEKVTENNVQLGDVLYIFPADAKGQPQFAWPSRPGGPGEVNPLSVGSLIGAIDGQFWNLELTASGDTLTMTPSEAKLGFVQNPGKSFTLSAFNKDQKAYMVLNSDAEGKAALPPGEWVLTGYSMTFQKEKPKPEASEEPKAEEAKEENSEKAAQEKVAKAIVNLLTGKKQAAEATDATVMAKMPGTDVADIKVVADETTEVKFGAPYKVTVNSYVSTQGENEQQAQLSVQLTGVLGESCSDIRLGQGRPPKPTFVISTTDGKEVESGAFEYG